MFKIKLKSGDSNGCLTFHYYEYCDVTKKCQSTETSSCPNQWDAIISSCKLDEDGCCKEINQKWCESSNSCVDTTLFSCPHSCA